MNFLLKNAGRVFLTLVFLFLYLPMASVVVYSFNASHLANEWTHFPRNGTESCCKMTSY